MSWGQILKAIAFIWLINEIIQFSVTFESRNYRFFMNHSSSLIGGALFTVILLSKKLNNFYLTIPLIIQLIYNLISFKVFKFKSNMDWTDLFFCFIGICVIFFMNKYNIKNKLS